ncbi:MAG: hypothetical protein WDA03_13085 [Trueperaceae bacterium]
MKKSIKAGPGSTHLTRLSIGDHRRSFYRSAVLGRASGITIIETLVVLAIAGILFALMVSSGRGTLESQQEQAAIRSIQQSIWQGSSAASARGRNTELTLTGRRIDVREVDSGRLVRTEELPAGVLTNLPRLVFTPPGKISTDSFALVADGISVSTSRGTTTLRVSVIGEVIAEKE